MPITDLSWITKLAGLAVPICAIALPAVLLYIGLAYKERRHRQLLDAVKHFADRGMPVPRELIDPPQVRLGPSLFYIACTFIGAGVGVAIMFYTLDLAFLTGVGALLACIGVAQLVALRLEPSTRDRPKA